MARAKTLLFVLIFLLGFCVSLRAETMTLWDGVKIEVDVKQVSSNGALVVYENEELLFPWSSMNELEAMRIWENHIDADDADAWFALGTFALKNGNKARAKSYFAKAVALEPELRGKVPAMEDKGAEKKKILALIGKAQKLEAEKKYSEALQTYLKILNWPDNELLSKVLQESVFLDPVMLGDHCKRLKPKIMKQAGFDKMGLRWVTKNERKLRESDLEQRERSDRLDKSDNERHKDWDNAWERGGRWYNIRTNVHKWYRRRYMSRLDILYDEFQDIIGVRVLTEQKLRVFIYDSRSLYEKEGAVNKPGTGSLGGFYTQHSIHLFLDGEQTDLAYEDISVMALNYLAAQLFLHSMSEDVPFWLDAGFGLYMQDAGWQSLLKVNIGGINRYALEKFTSAIDNGEVFDPNRLLNLDGGATSFDYYSAWALMQYLLGNKSSAKTTFLSAMKSFGKNKKAFDGLKSKANALKTDVVKYIRTLKQPLKVLEIPPYPMF